MSLILNYVSLLIILGENSKLDEKYTCFEEKTEDLGWKLCQKTTIVSILFFLYFIESIDVYNHFFFYLVSIIC